MVTAPTQEVPWVATGWHRAVFSSGAALGARSEGRIALDNGAGILARLRLADRLFLLAVRNHPSSPNQPRQHGEDHAADKQLHHHDQPYVPLPIKRAWRAGVAHR